MSKSNMMILQCKNDFICCKNVKVLKCLLGWQNVFVACTWQRGVSDAACTVSVSEYVKWAPIIYVLWLVMESYFQTDGNNRQFNYIRSFSFLFWFLQNFHFFSISFGSEKRFILFVFDILHFKGNPPFALFHGNTMDKIISSLL